MLRALIQNKIRKKAKREENARNSRLVIKANVWIKINKDRNVRSN